MERCLTIYEDISNKSFFSFYTSNALDSTHTGAELQFSGPDKIFQSNGDLLRKGVQSDFMRYTVRKQAIKRPLHCDK
jgi:hypothetical protein